MEVGPVELVLLTFPGERVAPAVVAAVADVVGRGYVTILDLMVATRDDRGEVRLTDVDQDLSGAGLEALPLEGRPLLSDADVELALELLPPGSSAVLVVYEETWARHLAGTVRSTGGEVALHLQLPRDTVETAFAAATGP
jgi:Family of unknown function (DUF6325)